MADVTQERAREFDVGSGMRDLDVLLFHAVAEMPEPRREFRPVNTT